MYRNHYNPLRKEAAGIKTLMDLLRRGSNALRGNSKYQAVASHLNDVGKYALMNPSSGPNTYNKAAGLISYLAGGAGAGIVGNSLLEGSTDEEALAALNEESKRTHNQFKSLKLGRDRAKAAADEEAASDLLRQIGLTGGGALAGGVAGGLIGGRRHRLAGILAGTLLGGGAGYGADYLYEKYLDA